MEKILTDLGLNSLKDTFKAENVSFIEYLKRQR